MTNTDVIVLCRNFIEATDKLTRPFNAPSQTEEQRLRSFRDGCWWVLGQIDFECEDMDLGALIEESIAEFRVHA